MSTLIFTAILAVGLGLLARTLYRRFGVLLKVVPVGLHPEWLTIPPDGKSLYVAVAGQDATVVVDTKTMKVVATIPVGFVPKRNGSGLLQTD